MWEHQCQATRKRGGQCTRKSTHALWTFAFDDVRFESATWVETCSHHLDFSGGIVSMLDIR